MTSGFSCNSFAYSNNTSACALSANVIRSPDELMSVENYDTFEFSGDWPCHVTLPWNYTPRAIASSRYPFHPRINQTCTFNIVAPPMKTVVITIRSLFLVDSECIEPMAGLFIFDGESDQSKLLLQVCHHRPELLMASMKSSNRVVTVKIVTDTKPIVAKLTYEYADHNSCDGHTCQNGGTCIPQAQTYICSCVEGFSGTQCETDIVDDCNSNPCVLGKCVDKINGYSCDCFKGVSGKRCDKYLGACTDSPCKHGKCLPLFNEYKCVCFLGYTGQNCEYNINECFSNPCVNGDCTDLLGNYSCACHNGYMGRNCEISKYRTDCQNYNCKYGTCAVNESGSFCQCFPGYTGLHCEININECESSPCGQHGRCIDHSNGYSCKCSTGYVGTHCNISMSDACQVNNCIHGICSLSSPDGNYRCICEKNYTGENCDSVITPCSSNPCLHGQCIDRESSFECECDFGYEGKHCDMNQTFCTNNSCVHGSCIEGSTNLTCNCNSGWSGEVCDVKTSPCSRQYYITTTQVYHVSLEAQETPSTVTPRMSSTETNHILSTETYHISSTETHHVLSTETKHISPTETRDISSTETRDRSSTETNHISPTETRDISSTETRDRSSTETYHISSTETQHISSTETHHTSSTAANPISTVILDSSTLGKGNFATTTESFTGHHRWIDHTSAMPSLETNWLLCIDQCKKGKCLLGKDRAECMCDDNYTGDSCDMFIGDFTTTKSSPSQTLLRLVSTIRVTKPDICAMKPCRFGTCHVFHSKPVCVCNNSSYTGSLCDTLITHNSHSILNSSLSKRRNESDICRNKPCVHGQCIQHVNGIICRCDPNYTGKECEVTLDNIDITHNMTHSKRNCTRTNCVNGACILKNNHYKCHCHEGFRGKFCNTSLHLVHAESDQSKDESDKTLEYSAIAALCVCLLVLIAAGGVLWFRKTRRGSLYITNPADYAKKENGKKEGEEEPHKKDRLCSKKIFMQRQRKPATRSAWYLNSGTSDCSDDSRHGNKYDDVNLGNQTQNEDSIKKMEDCAQTDRLRNVLNTGTCKRASESESKPTKLSAKEASIAMSGNQDRPITIRIPDRRYTRFPGFHSIDGVEKGKSDA